MGRAGLTQVTSGGQQAEGTGGTVARDGGGREARGLRAARVTRAADTRPVDRGTAALEGMRSGQEPRPAGCRLRPRRRGAVQRPLKLWLARESVPTRSAEWRYLLERGVSGEGTPGVFLLHKRSWVGRRTFTEERRGSHRPEALWRKGSPLRVWTWSCLMGAGGAQTGRGRPSCSEPGARCTPRDWPGRLRAPHPPWWAREWSRGRSAR